MVAAEVLMMTLATGGALLAWRDTPDHHQSRDETMKFMRQAPI